MCDKSNTERRHPEELMGNDRLGTQVTQVEGDKNNNFEKFTDEK